ncbi:MAG TPA: VTT domain-containing protein [Marmoricola sp.]|nr:VTT domain-containing protein [Marmoricola sp.]
MENALVGLMSDLGAWSLVVIGLIVFAESGLMTFFLPGDSMLFAAGVLAATDVVAVPVYVVALVVAASAFAGNQVGYAIGHHIGPRVLTRNGRLLSADRIQRCELFFARYGARSLVLARFLPVVRSFVPVIAGVGSMPRRRFVSFSLLGSSSWGVSLVLAGGLLGHIAWVADHVGLIGFALVGIAMLPALVSVGRSRLLSGRPARPGSEEPADPGFAPGSTGSSMCSG